MKRIRPELQKLAEQYPFCYEDIELLWMFLGYDIESTEQGLQNINYFGFNSVFDYMRYVDGVVQNIIK